MSDTTSHDSEAFTEVVPEQGATTVRTERFAAIDCGTNSIRLLIIEKSSDSVDVTNLTRELRLVRLGEGVDRTHEFAPAALERTFAAIDEYAAIIDHFDVSAVRFVATSATRDVSNREEFAEGIRARLGCDLTVLDGHEEAELSFTGAVAFARAHHPGPFLVIDIGGGSTEFVMGTSGVEYATSVDIGCVRMTERHIHTAPATAIAAAQVDIDAAIAHALAVVPAPRALTLVGVAGTVTTVAAIALGLSTYDSELVDGAVITAEQVAEVSDRVLGMTRDERLALPGVEEGRADVIAAGSLILRRIMDLTGAEHVVVSEHDILDATAWRLADETQW
jgi:exopolyphosphatase/guanosine-5'-triphosphate,3'-diphosphate pyrophosphatase